MTNKHPAITTRGSKDDINQSPGCVVCGEPVPTHKVNGGLCPKHGAEKVHNDPPAPVKTRTPKYRLEYLDLGKDSWTSAAWSGGRPTAKRLARHILVLERSTLPGGVNAHLGPTRIYKARIVEQATSAVIVTYQVF
jgi:hypothetical protein